MLLAIVVFLIFAAVGLAVWLHPAFHDRVNRAKAWYRENFETPETPAEWADMRKLKQQHVERMKAAKADYERELSLLQRRAAQLYDEISQLEERLPGQTPQAATATVAAATEAPPTATPAGTQAQTRTATAVKTPATPRPTTAAPPPPKATPSPRVASPRPSATPTRTTVIEHRADRPRPREGTRITPPPKTADKAPASPTRAVPRQKRVEQ